MTSDRNLGIRRLVSASLIALLITLALLLLMTRLILPSERDRVVTRMIQNIEFRQAAERPEPASIEDLELPPPAEVQPPRALSAPVVGSTPISRNESNTDPGADDLQLAREIDWWAEAQDLIQDLDDEAFRRWRIEQGHDRYASIMQGPIPMTNPVRGRSPAVDSVIAGYVNSYGEVERKISENCVMQMRGQSNDHSDFARNLPARVVCKAAQPGFSFDKEDLE